MGRRRLALAALVLLAGCGPTPPQAPGPQAHRLNMALSTFSTACGHATEIGEFSKSEHELAVTERQAQSRLPDLVRIYRQNPDWIFQGKTVAELVQMSTTFLDECGLHDTAKRLRQATSG